MIRLLNSARHLHSSTTRQAVSELSIPVPWGDIRGQVWGPAHGYPVLCLHGWSDNCGTFKNLIPLLPKECRYVAVDLPGHGRSSHRPPGVLYSFPLYVMDVRRVIDALQWNKFSILGHSMGGNVGTMFSSLYPEMVDSLVLLDTGGFLPFEEKEIPGIMKRGFEEMLQFEKQAKEKLKVYTYEKSVERLIAANPSLSEQSAQTLLERGLSQVEGGLVFSRDFRINLTNVGRITLGQSLVMLSKIQASVLVVLAEDGLVKQYPRFEKSYSALLQAHLDRNHKVVTVPGDHHIHLNKAEAVAPLVSDFLQNKVLSQSADQTNQQTSKL
ncbi:serine hydrolase-like protein [Brachionichthys hirsutus]|uniref:serine hydrolase-like protein n=1 Tax=Brachionichthys hirsutus TaxID=412623 RepID=UPI0036046F94